MRLSATMSTVSVRVGQMPQLAHEAGIFDCVGGESLSNGAVVESRKIDQLRQVEDGSGTGVDS